MSRMRICERNWRYVLQLNPNRNTFKFKRARNNFQKVFTNATQDVRKAKGLKPRPKMTKKAKLERPVISSDDEQVDKGEKQDTRKRIHAVSSSDDENVEKSKENLAPNTGLAAEKVVEYPVNDAEQDDGSKQGTLKLQVVRTFPFYDKYLLGYPC